MLKKSLLVVLFLAAFLFSGVAELMAQSIPRIDLSVSPVQGKEDYSIAIQTVILLTILSFGPAFITMMTSFTRIVIVFFFMRTALGTQSSPPNQVLVGLALFLTIYIMMKQMEEYLKDWK